MANGDNAKHICAADFETDPFLFNRIPEPFSWGFYDGDNYTDYFAETPEECTDQLYNHCKELCEENPDTKYRVYFHNGGKFDFHFMLDYLDEDIKLINGRIAQCSMFDGQIELRDSYLILPLPLKSHGKDDIDYSKMERPVRKKHKKEILAYQRTDVISLYDWVVKFTDQFGHKLTLASSAFEQLKQTGYDIPRTYKQYDEKFRPFYYGGRVQCFEVGAIEKPLTYIDINSAYPSAMMEKHPSGSQHITRLSLPKDGKLKGGGAYFAIIKARSKGCLPFRGENARLYFPTDDVVREYYATGWEIVAGLETNTLIIEKVVKVYDFLLREDFSEYVTKWYKIKNEAKQNGDKTMEQFAKLMLNSAYGKFGQDGSDFKDFKICGFGDSPNSPEVEGEKDTNGITEGNTEGNAEGKPQPRWEQYATAESGHSIYSLDNPATSYFNVAVAASITGYVRAVMWRAINNCERPLYCDTDSIICERFNGVISDKLGDWSLEGELQAAYIAQRKMYAVHLTDGSWKKACKGVRLSAEQIKHGVLTGEISKHKRDAPSFNLKMGTRFTERKTDFKNLEKNLLTNPD